jgi:hypothetical protein
MRNIMLSGRRVESNLSGGHMTEYDVHKMYADQVNKDTISSLHANHGVLEVRYADGTMEVYKKSKWRKKLKLIKKRT